MTSPSPPSIVDYEPPHRSTRSRPGPRAGVVLSVLLAALAASTCLRAEWMNCQAGGVLPKTFEGKWRVGTWWAAPATAARPLTPAEQARVRAERTRDKANSDLRDLVGSWGLAQYLVVPIGLMIALATVASRRETPRARWACAVCAGALLGAGFMAVWRGYFTSIID